MDPNRITYFGETDARNKKIRFGIKAKDRLKHLYIIGKTGMGKSTLLENMAIQDIQNGEGMCFMDPHGGTAEKLLEYVPESRLKDVLYFAPFDMEYPISFNVLEDVGADKRHLVVNGLMSTFEKIWVDAWSARMAYILSNTLLALLEYPGSTLLGVNRMLTDKDYRKKIVENIKDPSVKTFWVDEFGKWTEKFVAEAIPAIQNKVGQFTANPLVRNLLGQPHSTFDLRKMMDEKKIMIVNLSKGRVGEGNANLIGSMLITKIYLAAMSRADSSEAQLATLPNFYLYVDEFQSFANKSFADILSEARKYKLNLTIAHQYIEQMEEEVRNAVFGNVGTMITFRVGAFDAEVLEKEFAPTFTAEDLVNLGFAQVYLKLMIDGVSSAPFSATTMAPIARPEIMFKDQVIESSRSQFARPRADVEEVIKNWHQEALPMSAPTRDGAKPAPGSASVRGPENQNDRREQPREQWQERPQERSQSDTRNGAQQSAPLAERRQDSVPRQGGEVRSEQRAPQAEQRPQSQPVAQKQAEQKPVERGEQKIEQPKVVLEQAPAPASQPDPNKLAFMKVAEELKAKQAGLHREPASQPSQPAQSSQPKPEEKISLASIAPKATDKNPTSENISNLKAALAQVLAQKPAAESAPQTTQQPSQQAAQHVVQKAQQPQSEQPRPAAAASTQPVSPRPAAPVDVPPSPKPEQKPLEASQEKPQQPKAPPQATSAPQGSSQTASSFGSMREVPEDVLRRLLSMEDA